ncbi:hypothetical protein QF034_007491 [Streptomyces africanus]|uniref:Uncharacterized protein n=1 Tax=Streptomyces africanus TaxID=231024 RepID=A0ABU0R0S3_9ACTN|nr:hypothetical protein [Streptomyces africanus]MDQ0753260.1 hypothetical protein [Streptomyces africanus]
MRADVVQGSGEERHGVQALAESGHHQCREQRPRVGRRRRGQGLLRVTDLVAATGWSAAAVARPLADLRGGGALFFDVELDNTLLGVTTQATLWMADPHPPAR